ncbi:MAG TPA: AlkA N-terminal domain-containing protein [Verrucomicrobiae bacterium]|nr:AlkA N-terminal domain-containing protein [Verrucomicrobiae bacterium]
MTLDSAACYRALRARDPRFDGRLFVAIRSTGVYCRPICTIATPKREHCEFYASAAAAEARGYRPCLRCRPELAPGSAGVDAGSRLARAAASAIGDGALDGGSLTGLAAALRTTDRHLRRSFNAHFGVTPIAYARTQRLLLAKRLLTDTQLSVTQVARASGFGSLRRFNALFKRRYRLNPAQLRSSAEAASSEPAVDAMAFSLAFRPPYDWPSLLAFLGARTIGGVEEAEDGAYRRALRVERRGCVASGWIEVSLAPGASALRVLVSGSLLDAIASVLGRVEHVMDLTADPHEIAAVLGPLAALRPGLRVPGAFDGFEVAVRAVIGQQVSVKGARTIAGRFAAAFGTAIETPFAGVSRLFPRAADVAGIDPDRIASLGIIGTRARTIARLAQAIARGELDLRQACDVPATLDALRAIPGIGEWTAQYIVMRALGWPDAFPHGDLGLRKALRENDPKNVLLAGEAWRPWRAYAAMHLWHTL